MDIRFWHERWRDEKIGFHQHDYNELLCRFWREMSLPAGSTVFVPFCGKSLDMLWLGKQGYHVIGAEVSDIAVSAFFTENGLSPVTKTQGEFTVWSANNICIYCGDFFSLDTSLLGHVDAVYDRAALIALPKKMRKHYFQHLRVLTEGAEMLLVTLEYPQAQMSGPPFSVPEAEVRELFSQAYVLNKLYDEEILALEENQRFRDRGLSRLSEQVFLMKCREISK